MANFALIGELLLELISKTSQGAENRSTREAREYIDVDEYGLALEAITYAMVSNGRAPSSDEIVLGTRIAQQMGLDYSSMLREAIAKAGSS